MSKKKRTEKKKEAKIYKPIGIKVCELLSSLQIIKDSLDLYMQGKKHEIIPISGQLRAILTDSTAKKNGVAPLLFELAKVFNYDTSIYYSPINMEGCIQDGLVLQMVNPEPSLINRNGKQKKIRLSEFLDINICEVNKKKISARKLITWYANKSGGAHYDPTLPESFIMLRKRADFLIIEMAKIALSVGVNIVRETSCFEKYIGIKINQKQEINNYGCIFEFSREDSLMFYKLIIDDKFNLIFSIRSEEGEYIEVKSDREIKWDKARVILLTSEITEDFSTKLALYIDGEKYGESNNKYPIYSLANPLIYYNRYYNTNRNKSIDGIEMDISSICIYGRLLDENERKHNLLYLEDDIKKGNFRIFNRDKYGVMLIGEKDMHIKSR